MAPMQGCCPTRGGRIRRKREIRSAQPDHSQPMRSCQCDPSCCASPTAWHPSALRAMGAVRVVAHRGAGGSRQSCHAVFATADSITTASLHATAPWGWSEDATIDAKVAECLHVASVFERADKFDIINNGFDFLPLTYIDLVPTPRHHHNPRLVVRSAHSRLQALRQHHRVCVDKRL